MKKQFPRILSFFLCRRKALSLALVWIGGLLSGLLLAELTGDTYTALMRTAAQNRVSIVGLFAVTCLPFLFTAFAVFISRPSLIYGAAFVQALLFSWCGLGVLNAYGSAGWLVRLLLQFSSGCALSVFCWFCIRCLQGKTLKKDLFVSAAVLAVICSIDYCFVSPFLVMLIDM